MMLVYKHEERLTIHAATADVFAVVADVGNHAALAGSEEVRTIRITSAGPTNVGTTWQADETIRIGKQTKSFVAESIMREWDPPSVVSWTSTPPMKPTPRRIQWWYQLTPGANGGTDLVERVEVDMGPIANVFMKIPYRQMRGRIVAAGMRKTLQNVADIAERPR